jgi:ketosteroid isomerase-like protein
MSERENSMVIDSNKHLVGQFIDVLGRLNLESAAAMMHDNYVCEIPCITMRPDTFSKTGLLAYLGGLGAFLPEGIRFEIVEMTAEADRVSTIANGFATTVEGKVYNNRYHFLHYVAEGKIIRQLEYMDSFLGAKVLGPLMQKSAQCAAAEQRDATNNW